MKITSNREKCCVNMDGYSDVHPITSNVSLHVVPDNTRQLFYWLILTISVSAVIGNVLAIRSIIKRKTKFLQKCCIVSLAMADIFTVVLFSTNNLETLSNELMIWTLGEFMCYFIPMGQLLGTTASSMTLLVISLDRYQNVVYALSRRWNPRPVVCVALMLSLFAICTVLSYPMALKFNYEPVWILFVGPYSKKPLYQFAHMCVASKPSLTIYYFTMTALIFIPVLSIFIWFYFKIAVLIWIHRKPFSSRFSKSENKLDTEDPSFSTTKSTALSTVSTSPKPPVKKGRSIHVERKIRTFRIVLVLMVSFAFCRLPYWCFYITRLIGNLTSATSWNISFALIALNLLNCALNPLLYTFLNETINGIKMINDFMCKVCCCCFCNDEFEEFEKENVFPIKRPNSNKNLNNKTVKFGSVHFCEKNTNGLPRY